MWSDPLTNMAYGNQWMNPAHYKNMTNEQVDWASLAQQWIKMKETAPVMPHGSQGRTTNESKLIGAYQPIIDPQNSSHLSTQNKTLGNHSVPSSITGNANEKPSAWNTWTWQQQQQWNWNWASSSAPPIKTTTIDPVNPIKPPYVTPPLLTEPPPLPFPIISQNKQFPSNNYWAGPNNRIPPPIESDQWNKVNMVSNVDDRNQDLSFIDAAKRKQLPAWIREGLEKMEKEKRRKMEVEQPFEKHDFSLNNEIISQDLCNSPNSFERETQMVDEIIEHNDSPEYNNDTESKKTELMKKDPSPLIPRKTKAQIWEDTMLNLRHILTKVLMDVTNDMMLNVAKDVLKTTKLQTDKQGNQSTSSLAGKLGLGVYGSASESSDENDEEQQPSGHKKSFSQDSTEVIQERLVKRQREFVNIEAKILMELDQLEDREKTVRSKFDNSVKLSGDTNESSQVVENIHTKGRVESERSSQKPEKGYDKTKKDLSNDSNNKNGQKKRKSRSKRSSSSSLSSSSSESKSSDDSDYKYRHRKYDKTKSKSLNKKTKTDSVKRKRRSRSRNRSKRSRSRSRHRSNSRSRHYDRRSPHSYRSRRSRSPISRYGSSRKYKNKRNSSSSSNESRSTKHRYRR